MSRETAKTPATTEKKYLLKTLLKPYQPEKPTQISPNSTKNFQNPVNLCREFAFFTSFLPVFYQFFTTNFRPTPRQHRLQPIHGIRSQDSEPPSRSPPPGQPKNPDPTRANTPQNDQVQVPQLSYRYVPVQNSEKTKKGEYGVVNPHPPPAAQKKTCSKIN